MFDDHNKNYDFIIRLITCRNLIKNFFIFSILIENIDKITQIDYRLLKR